MTSTFHTEVIQEEKGATFVCEDKMADEIRSKFVDPEGASLLQLTESTLRCVQT
jgi:hypothetical protein